VLEEEKFPTKIYKVIKFGKKSHAECSVFSPDGQYLVSGSVDGFVEVWDFDTGKLCKDLKYQAEDDFMMHDEPISDCSFSKDGELLATGDIKGTIKIWKIRTGSCVRKFPSAHTGCVSSVVFARDGTQILSASHDNTIKIHGLKSGRALKEFRGHKNYVNSAIYTDDSSMIVSVSADGTAKVWDVKTTDCTSTFKPHGQITDSQSDTAGNALSLTGITQLSRHMDRLLVVAKSPTMHMTSMTGQIIQTYKCPGGDISCYCVSPKGNYLYAVAEDKVMYCFNIDTGIVEHVMKLHKNNVIGLAHHPHRNIFGSYGYDGTLKLWRP